jgi:hypothetical protein
VDSNSTPKIGETPDQNLPLLHSEFRTLRKNVHDSLHGRKKDIISSGLVVATNNILSISKVTKDTFKVRLPNIPSDTPAERTDVVVEGVVHRS